MKILIPSQKYTTYIQLHTHTHTHLIITSYNDTRRVCKSIKYIKVLLMKSL